MYSILTLHKFNIAYFVNLAYKYANSVVFKVRYLP